MTKKRLTMKSLQQPKSGNITKEDLYEEMKDAIGIPVVENLLLQQALETEYKISDKELKEEIKKQKEAIRRKFRTIPPTTRDH